MKKTAKTKDELRPKYDFASMKGDVPGKYAERYRQGTNIVMLEDDVASVFHDSQTVNEALRSLIRIAEAKVKHV